MAQVIAANYAFSIGAGLQIIPAVSDAEAEALLEQLYSLYADQERAPSEILSSCIEQLRERIPLVDATASGSVTFVTRRLPYGLALPEIPSTHLFSYPDLGIAVLNGLAAEQSSSEDTKVALLIDPGVTEAEEIEATASSLASRHVLVRGVQGSAANVRDVGREVELFPYDLLVFATHCGDAPGYRETYEFVDSEGLERRLVIDIALGIGREGADGRLEVLKFMRFHSLDDVAWNDPDRESKVHVGTAIQDWAVRERGDNGLRPVRQEHIPRVAGSAALKMYDNNYIAVPTGLAGNGTPIVFNNACASWNELAGRFFFAGARAYVGTLFPITSAEAAEVAAGALDKHFGQPLAEAVWLTQNEVYGSAPRRPYVVSGVYPQKLRANDLNVPELLALRLIKERRASATGLAGATNEDERRHYAASTDYYEEMLRQWGALFGRQAAHEL